MRNRTLEANYLIAIAVGLICLWVVSSNASEAQSAILFGLSFPRLVLTIFITGLLSAFIILFFKTTFNSEFYQKQNAFFKSSQQHHLRGLFAFLAFAFSFYVLQTQPYLYKKLSAFYSPLLISLK